MVALELDLVAPAVILGAATAGLYGLLAVPLVLTYRVSRTIGFVQGGIALFAMFLYWWLTGAGKAISPDRLPRAQGVLTVVVAGSVLGTIYGWTVMGKLANWPRLRLTTYSLGWLLGLVAAIVLLFLQEGAGFQTGLGMTIRLPSVFGTRRLEAAGAVLSVHQVATAALLTALVVVLQLLLHRTRTGTFIRAIADDPDASRWVGIPINRVGTAVYAASGALSALAGVLMTTTIGLDLFLALVVFLRALTVSVLGGFRSIPLALGGCLVLAVGETLFAADGSLTQGQREGVIMALLFVLVFAINRLRPLAIESGR